MPTVWLELPDGLECLRMLDDDEAQAICWEHCQNDDDCKVGCLTDDCPLGRVELQRLLAYNKQCAETLKVMGRMKRRCPPMIFPMM